MGEYLILLDGDDYFSLDHLENAVKILDNYNCEMCIANNHINFTENRRTTVTLFPFEETMNQCTFEENLRVIFDEKNYLPASAVLTIYKTQFLRENNLKYEESYTCSEDLDFFLHAISVVKNIKFMGHQFYYYRQDNLSAMTKNITGEMYLSRLSIYKKWFDYYKKASLKDFDCNMVNNCLAKGFQENIIAIWKLPSCDKHKKEAKKYVLDNKYLWNNVISVPKQMIKCHIAALKSIIHKAKRNTYHLFKDAIVK